MNKLKLIAAALAALLLLLPLTPAVHAAASSASGLLGGLMGEGSPFGDLLNGILEGLGGNGQNGENGDNIQLSDLFSNPNGVLDTIRERIGSTLSNTELIEAISELLGGAGQSFSVNDLLSNEFLNRLRKYLGMAEVTDPPATEEPTSAANTAPASTAPIVTSPPQTVYYYYVPSTIAPAAPATTVYSGAQTYSVPSTTAADETYSYIQPEIVTVAPITTLPAYSPSVVEEDTTETAKSGSTAKTVIGIIILVLSLAAVVVVAVILRKSKI